jgi:small subunit ribosomal protein S2
VQQIEIAPEFIGEEDEVAVAEVQESVAVEAAAEDEVVDLDAVLGGGIRKAPSATIEPETAQAEATA